MSLRPLALLLLAASACRAAEPFDLTPDALAWRHPVVVDAELRLAGEVTPEAAQKAKAEPQPIGMTTALRYRQECLAIADGEAARVARVVTGQDRRTRVYLAKQTDGGVRVAAADGPLTRRQLDAVQLPADPLDLDTLLPGEAVHSNDSWKVAPAAIQRVLRIDSVTLCEVIGVVEAATQGHAKLRLAGPVHGAADGATTQIDLQGVALFDRNARRITRLNLAWSETRQIGPATPSVEATAKLNVSLRPAADDERLDAVDLLLAETTEPDQRLAVTTGDGGWRVLVERDWFVVASDRHATTLRRVEEDRVAAVMTLTPSGRRFGSLGELEGEVRDTLGEGLKSLLATEQGSLASAGQMMAIAAAGRLDGQPVEWRRHHVQSDDGATLAATTTLPTPDGPADDAAVRRVIESLARLTRTSETAAARATAVRR